VLVDLACASRSRPAAGGGRCLARPRTAVSAGAILVAGYAANITAGWSRTAGAEIAASYSQTRTR
jgi:hypothetical protein